MSRLVLFPTPKIRLLNSQSRIRGIKYKDKKFVIYSLLNESDRHTDKGKVSLLK